MIGKIYKVRFCCDNPIGETWYHNTWKLFTPFDHKYFANNIHGEPFIIEVYKGYIPSRGDFVITIHDEVIYQKRPCRFEIWQKLTIY